MYLVSGDENIRPSDVNIRQSGRQVRYDGEVGPDAAIELTHGGEFVVVAHGRQNGTVMWCATNRGAPVPWLWVGMDNPPSGTRVYVYACSAGEKLAQFLVNCESLGHRDVVPMPVDGAREFVLSYFDEVDRLISTAGVGVEQWRVGLAKFVNDALVVEAGPEGSWEKVAALLMLRRSMGYVDA